jgi:hypothetical protein
MCACENFCLLALALIAGDGAAVEAASQGYNRKQDGDSATRQ